MLQIHVEKTIIHQLLTFCNQSAMLFLGDDLHDAGILPDVGCYIDLIL